MKRIDQETKQRILDTAQIVDVVSDFVKLRRRGSGYIGLCPFHNERTPSFSVSPSRNFCKCFSCGKGGSPVNFIMELEKLNYQEALRYLAKKYNIEIQEREMTPAEIEAQNEREAMTAVNDWALKYFENVLHETREGRDVGKSYFMERGLTEPTIRKFRLGYCTESHDAMYKQAIAQGFTDKYIMATGLAARTERGMVYDRFRARVIYPVFSVSGKVIAFGGRTLRSDKVMAKYVNSPESVIYNKRNELYGLYQAKNSIVSHDKVYLVEGYMDVISMAQNGVENVVASSGTSLTTGQIRLLRRFTKNVTVIYDSDAAGIKASLRGIDLLLAEGLEVKVVQFPPGEDPDSFAQSHTSEELTRYLAENETDFIRFKTSILLADGAENDPARRAHAITEICRSIAAIPELIGRTVYITETGRTLGIDESVVALQVAKMLVDNTEQRKIEEERERARKSIEPVISTPQDSPDTVKRADTTAVAQSVNTLLPFELEILKYIIKYGLLEMNLIDSNDAKIRFTVLDYIRQQMDFEGIGFTDPVCRLVFETACNLVDSSWQNDYLLFCGNLEVNERQWILEGEEEIRSRADGIENIAGEELILKQKVAKRRSDQERAFRTDYIRRRLTSSEDDSIRSLATRLVAERYKLSNVHRRTGAIMSPADQLEEMVTRAFCEWQDATLDVEIKRVNDEIAHAAANSPNDYEGIRSLMERKAELMNYKREFAKVLGERILAPRRH